MIDKAKKINYQLNNRLFSEMKKAYLFKLKNWRNSQRNILRQEKLLTDNDQKEWFKRINNDPTQVIFAIQEINKENHNKFIGYCGIVNINFNNLIGEISFLVEADRAKNLHIYCKDFLASLYVLCCYGFERLNLHKLYTETYMFRDKHIKILEDFGFKLTETLRNRKCIKGEYWHSVIHSLLINEWPPIKKELKSDLEK